MICLAVSMRQKTSNAIDNAMPYVQDYVQIRTLFSCNTKYILVFSLQVAELRHDIFFLLF